MQKHYLNNKNCYGTLGWNYTPLPLITSMRFPYYCLQMWVPPFQTKYFLFQVRIGVEVIKMCYCHA